MGRARRLHRSRRDDVRKPTPRFAVGSPVQCYYGLQWAKGNVVAHNYEEPKHVFHPYQVRLQDGSLIFAPEDSDEYIQANWTKPRFEIGTCVLCKYGDQWVKGTVVMHNCEASMGVFHPYQVKLHHGAWVYVPADEDTFIQRAAFAVGDRVRVRNLTQKNDILGTIVGQLWLYLH